MDTVYGVNCANSTYVYCVMLPFLCGMAKWLWDVLALYAMLLLGGQQDRELEVIDICAYI